MVIYKEIAEVMENARRKRPPQDLACMTGALGANAAFCAKRGRRGGKNEALINFSPPFVSRFAQRSPRMANKAHVMQANADLTHDLTHNS